MRARCRDAVAGRMVWSADRLDKGPLAASAAPGRFALPLSPAFPWRGVLGRGRRPRAAMECWMPGGGAGGLAGPGQVAGAGMGAAMPLGAGTIGRVGSGSGVGRFLGAKWASLWQCRGNLRWQPAGRGAQCCISTVERERDCDVVTVQTGLRLCGDQPPFLGWRDRHHLVPVGGRSGWEREWRLGNQAVDAAGRLAAGAAAPERAPVAPVRGG